MESELWRPLYREVRRQRKARLSARHHFTLADVALVSLWAALHDRPRQWACDPRHWPGWARRPRRLPSGPTLSRHLRAPAVQALLARVEALWRPARDPADPLWVDGKPLPVGGSAGDREARYGRAAGGFARGYKLHAIADPTRGILAWRVLPMCADERRAAADLVAGLTGPGVLVGDANYDAGHLYDAAAARGYHLLAPPRRVGRGHGHRPQSPHRHAGRRLAATRRGRALLAGRRGVERLFGQLVTPAGGLGPLPAWVRGLRRVTDWVWAKLTLFNVRRWLRRQATAA